MSKPRKVNPATSRPGVPAPDSDLQRVIRKAQAEFSGRSKTEMAALWANFEILLNTWRAQGGGYAPLLQPERRTRGGRAPDEARPDYVETFVQLADRRFVLLPRFIRSLDRKVRLGLIKALALLILREAADGNPAGALRASAMFDKALAEFLIATGKSSRGRDRTPVQSGAASRHTEKPNKNRIAETIRPVTIGTGSRRQYAREGNLKSTPPLFPPIESRKA